MPVAAHRLRDFASLRAKRLARTVIPPGRRLQARNAYNGVAWRLYRGDEVACNCCDTSFRRFQRWVGDDGTVLEMCPRCGALGRHRGYWRFLSLHPDLLEPPLRILHVAPEPCLQRRFRGIAGVDYVSADLEAADVQVHMDVTDIPFADDSFDVVVCNHVLEHVDDDLKALSELRRVVRPGGWAMIQVPLDPARAGTVEDPTISDPKLREELFGQHDHVRAYGRDYVGRLERAGFAVSEHDVADGLAAEDVQRLGLEQREPVYLARCV